MPLKRGRSRKVVGSNIRELLNTFKRTGKIGATTPTTAQKARKIAAAIALRKSRESR